MSNPKSKGNIDQKPDEYKVGDEVYIAYEPNSVARSYFQKRRKITKIVRVDTRSFSKAYYNTHSATVTQS